MSKSKDIIHELGQLNKEILLADGFDKALIGIGQIYDKSIAVYDRQKVIDIIINDFGTNIDDAEDYFNFNVVGAYVGEYTPVFVELF